METKTVDRREFIKSLLAGVSVVALDWNSFPISTGAARDDKGFDAVIIGSGLGGLSCAAAFARQGFKPLVLEKHDRPGGYATTFSRPGGFVFDVSLHSTTVGDREGIHNLIYGFPEITDVEFVPHRNLYRIIYPDYDLRVPQKDVAGYVKLLARLFPDEQRGIQGLLDDMKGLSDDISRYSNARGKIDMNRFPQDFPFLFNNFSKTWGTMVNARIKDPKLQSIVSSLWGYYGLPPSMLSSFYYALPTYGYLRQGGYYPKGRSQKISDAFVKFIEDRGGKVVLNSRVTEILTKDHAAYGVKTADGKEYAGRVVVSNSNAFDTFHSMPGENDVLKEYVGKFDRYSVSLSSFQVFLGLKEDLVGKIGIEDSEIFYHTSYDHEAGYEAALTANMDNTGYGLTLYDNIYKGYSPEGKNTLSLLVLQGYDHWKEFEEDYFKGNKTAYRAEKERMADILIKKAEETLLPGLSSAIEVKEIATPLTNLRYTGNTRGAIYGWDQTLGNSGQNRVPHTTPIKNLYLSGAWTRPGHGYGGVIGSGLECFGEIMGNWKS
ncbi:MAG: NAD(P)/FAD-dependent oxidoreductase [Bacteroidota bacterium]|jgi:phytoene dehydrogenase-like protein